MSTELVARTSGALSPSPAASLPPVPWRDPHTVSPDRLAAYIEQLEQACREYPQSADLHTCLGMAYAVNYDVYKSMDALEAATTMEPDHFWAQVKYAELHYRLRALPRAETEALKAVNLARNPWELSTARRLLHDVRDKLQQSTRTVVFDKPLLRPVLALCAVLAAMFAVMLMA